MARRRATNTVPHSPSLVRPRGTAASDRTLYTHNLWLNYLKPVSLGLVFSPSALRAAQVELPPQASDAQRALEAMTVASPCGGRRSSRPGESPAHASRSASTS